MRRAARRCHQLPRASEAGTTRTAAGMRQFGQELAHGDADCGVADAQQILDAPDIVEDAAGALVVPRTLGDEHMANPVQLTHAHAGIARGSGEGGAPPLAMMRLFATCPAETGADLRLSPADADRIEWVRPIRWVEYSAAAEDARASRAMGAG